MLYVNKTEFFVLVLPQGKIFFSKLKLVKHQAKMKKFYDSPKFLNCPLFAPLQIFAPQLTKNAPFGAIRPTLGNPGLEVYKNGLFLYITCLIIIIDF